MAEFTISLNLVLTKEATSNGKIRIESTTSWWYFLMPFISTALLSTRETRTSELIELEMEETSILSASYNGRSLEVMLFSIAV